MTRASDTAKLIGAGATILDGTTITTADNTEQLTLISTDEDANQGPVLRLRRDSASPADNDIVGYLVYSSDNDAGQITDFGGIRCHIDDASDGTEDGNLKFFTNKAGTEVSRMGLASGETVFNEDSVDVDFRVESNGNANMLFVDGGNNRVAIGETAPLGTLHVRSSDASITSVNANSDDLILENNGNCGITIASSTTGEGMICFSDSGDTNIGRIQYQHDNNQMNFRTNDSERMRILQDGSNNGRIYINADDPSSNSYLTVSGNNNTHVMITTNDTSTSGGAAMRFKVNSSTVGQISCNASNTTYTTSSDYRLKENVIYDFDATSRLKQLKPSRFNFIANPDTTVDGFLAHEVSSIVPEAITGEKDETENIDNVVLNANGTVNSSGISQSDWTAGKSDETYASDTTWVASKTVPKYQGIDQSKLVPLLVKTIQELEARITTLENA